MRDYAIMGIHSTGDRNQVETLYDGLTEDQAVEVLKKLNDSGTVRFLMSEHIEGNYTPIPENIGVMDNYYYYRSVQPSDYRAIYIQ